MMPLLLTLAGGVEGLPLIYSPRRDDGIAFVLLCCFFLSSYVLSRNRKFLVQLIKDFLLHRERSSIFTTSTASDVRSLLLLTLQTCVLCSVTIFCCCVEYTPPLAESLPTLAVIGIYFVLCLLYLLVKWGIYSFLGWIFFDKSKVDSWLESYSTLLYYLGFLLFPSVLFCVYFDLGLSASVLITLIFLSFTKILMFYKWIKLFCEHFYGSLLLIVYFCALEVVPCVLLFDGILQLNEYLTIKI